jgi:ribonuclease HII
MSAAAKFIIGIDEVGRGALAGPVVVCAAMVAGGGQFLAGAIHHRGKLKDSKKLSPKKREAWFAYFKNHPQITFAVARVYPRGIERLNISQAANLAAKRAYERLVADQKAPVAPHKIYLDGGLFLGKDEQSKNAKTLIKADEKITAVKIASIIAKVYRDRFMVRLAKKYSGYGFDVHKGYGTKAHYRALKNYGLSDVHRKTFFS